MCQLDKFDPGHKTVREVDELMEQAVDVWRERAWHKAMTAEAERAVQIVKCRCLAGCGGTMGWSVAAVALARQRPAWCPAGYKDAPHGKVATANKVWLRPGRLAGWHECRQRALLVVGTACDAVWTLQPWGCSSRERFHCGFGEVAASVRSRL